jgi:adenylosuccinate lyase
LDLVESGVSREDAYRLVQSHAMHAWREDLNFHDLVVNDPTITGRVSRTKIERAFDLKRQLKNIDKIFARVFDVKIAGKPSAGKKRGKKKSARRNK